MVSCKSKICIALLHLMRTSIYAVKLMNRFIVFYFRCFFFCSFSFVARFFYSTLQNSWRCWRTKIKRTKCWRVKIFNYRYVWRRFKLFPSSPVDCCVLVIVCAWVWARALFVLFFLFVRSFWNRVDFSSIFFFSHFILFLFDSLFSCNFVRSFTLFFLSMFVIGEFVCSFIRFLCFNAFHPMWKTSLSLSRTVHLILKPN